MRAAVRREILNTKDYEGTTKGPKEARKLMWVFNPSLGIVYFVSLRALRAKREVVSPAEEPSA